MDPLTPTTSTLTPAISHIAETAATLSSSFEQQTSGSAQQNSDKELQQKTVRWVLEAPSRLRQLRAGGGDGEARKDWKQVAKLLDRWQDIQGVAEIRAQCEDIMNGQGET